MQAVIYERPGVYSSYSASTVSSRSAGRKAVGLVAYHPEGEGDSVAVISSVEEGVALYGSSTLTNLLTVALNNGAASVHCVAMKGEASEPATVSSQEEEFPMMASATQGMLTLDQYKAGFALLERVEELPLILCDSTELEVQQALRDSVVLASGLRKERIGIVACGADATVAEMTAKAQQLNSERMALVGGRYTAENGESGILYAAALAGLIAMESDPALPLNGLTLLGVPALEKNDTDNEMDALILGGVIPLEQSGGLVSVVRGVTTRTLTEGAQDYTWRDLSTILVVDDVIPSLRDTLRVKFQRSKNTEQSRGAIRSQVVLALESKLASEIIVSYDGISVTASEEDPTICLVDFSFGVAHGLNQIWISAHVNV